MSVVNQAIVDKLLAGQLDLLRLEAGARNAAFKLLTKLEAELKAKLRLADLTMASKARMRSLLKQTDQVIADYYARIDATMKQTLQGAAKAQASHVGDVLDEHFVGEVNATLPTTTAMRALVGDTLVMGAPSSDWWAKQAQDVQFRFANAVRQGVTQGETMGDLVRRVAGGRNVTGVMEIARTNARSLVHTSVMEVSAEARKETYARNDDVVEGFRQVSTLDSNTTDICAAYDGAEYSLDGEPLEGTDLPYNGGVPRHWGCRSTEVPITKTFKELGINAPEPKGGERASADGPVPAKTTFADFLERMGSDFQDETLGPGRAELWRDGKLTLPDLLDLKGNPLTLDQLERKYG